MNINLNKKRLIILILGIIIFGSILYLFNKEEAKESSPEERAKKVEVLKIGEENPNNSLISAVGSVKADSRVSIVSMQAATVREIYFSVGDEVKEGQVLAKLDDNNILTSLINAQTDYANRQNNLEIINYKQKSSMIMVIFLIWL